MFAFHETATGHNHIIKNPSCKDYSTLCEDASDSISNERYYIAIVADGHGAKECFRSGVGAKFAVEVTKQCLKDFAESIIITPKEIIKNETIFITPRPSSEELLCDSKYYRNQEIKRLTDTIIDKWHDKVKNHYKTNSPTEEELKKNKVEDMDIKNLPENKIFHIYGTTLIAGLMLPKSLILIQQGDGRCEVFVESNKGLEIRQPIPWDTRCEYNVTTSMCDEDVVDSIRSCFIDLTKEKVIACYLGSDGVEDAYRDTYEDLGDSHGVMGGVHTFYKYLSCKIVGRGEHILQYLRDRLPTFSEKGLFSRTGSGDDVSVAGIVDIDALSKYVDKFKKDIEIYKLDEEIFWKDDELRGKTRKHGILKQNYLNSEMEYDKAENEYNNFVDAYEKRKRLGKSSNLYEDYELRKRGRALKQKCKDKATQCRKNIELFNEYNETFSKIQEEIDELKQKKSERDYQPIFDKKQKIYYEETQKELDEIIERLGKEIEVSGRELEVLEEEIKRFEEEERRRKIEEERRRKEEEARRRAEAERRKAEEARRKAEAEAKRKAEAERRRKEEEARRKAGQKDSGGFDFFVQQAVQGLQDWGQQAVQGLQGLQDWGQQAVQGLQEDFNNNGVKRASFSGIVSDSAVTSNIEHEHNMDLSQELEVQGVEQQTSSIDSSNDSVAGDTVPEINESGTPVNTDIAISKNAEASEEVKETNQESTEFDESKENVEETKQEVTEPVDNVEQEDEEKSQFSVSKVIEYIADSPSNNSEEKISIVEQSSQTGSVNNPEVIDFCESGTDNSMSPVTGKTDSEDLAKNLSDDSSNNLEIGDTVPEINESGTPVNTDISTSTNAEASEEVKETNQEPTEFDESKENVEETKQEVTEPVDLTDNLEGTDSKESATYSTTSEGGEQPQSSSQVLSDDSSNDSSENNTQPVNEPKENVTEETSLEVIASVDSEETDSKESETDETTTSEDKEHLKVDSKDLSDDSIIGIEGKDQSSSDPVDNNVTQSPEEEQELADTADPFAHLNNIRPLIEAEMDSEESGTDETTTSESEEQPQDDQQQTLIEDFSANSMVKETTQPVESIKDVEESRADEQRDNEAYSSSLLDTSKDIESVIDSSDDTPNDDQGTPANVDSDSAKETDSKESETNETTTSKGGEQPQDDTQNLSDDSISDSAGNNTQPIDEPKENVAQPKQEEKGFADHIDSAGREIQPDKVEISDKLKAKKEVRNEDGSIPIEVKHTQKSNNNGETIRVVNSHYSERRMSKEKYSCSVSRKFKVQLEIYPNPNPEFEEDD